MIFEGISGSPHRTKSLTKDQTLRETSMVTAGRGPNAPTLDLTLEPLAGLDLTRPPSPMQGPELPALCSVPSPSASDDPALPHAEVPSLSFPSSCEHCSILSPLPEQLPCTGHDLWAPTGATMFVPAKPACPSLLTAPPSPGMGHTLPAGNPAVVHVYFKCKWNHG